MRLLILGWTVVVLGGVNAVVANGDGEGGAEGQATELQRYEFTERKMGVAFTLTFYAQSKQTATKAASAAFAEVERLNGIFSDYDPKSELSQLSEGSAHQQPVPISKELARVLTTAKQLSRRSDGAFDVTVGPLTRLWRRARRQQQIPANDRLTAALAAVSYKNVLLVESDHGDMSTAQLTRPNMRLDLGGIAKGYAADAALHVLTQHGINRALVDGSGDVKLGDPPPGESGWQVGVAPLKPDGPPSMQLRLANCAIATSGDAWQHVVIDDVRYSHIVDPRTGLGLTHQGAVTVIAPNCMYADAMASAISVLGAERGIALAEKTCNVGAIYTYLDADGKLQKVSTEHRIFEEK